MPVYVIFCNDSAEYAVVGNNAYERAKERLLELKRNFFERNKGHFVDFRTYEAACRWHIQEVASEK